MKEKKNEEGNKDEEKMKEEEKKKERLIQLHQKYLRQDFTMTQLNL